MNWAWIEEEKILTGFDKLHQLKSGPQSLYINIKSIWKDLLAWWFIIFIYIESHNNSTITYNISHF